MTSIPLAGVLGQPVAHSLSPLVHGHWLRRFGLAGHYVPLDVGEGDLRRVLETLPAMGFVGCNVTIPHKERVLNIADQVSERAAGIGSANTLTFTEQGLHADNTDGYGFLANLRAGAPNWVPEAGPAAVIGAGGAARAVIVSLLEAGVPEIRLSNRTRARAEALADEFGPRVVVWEWSGAAESLEGAGTVVNASSLGMVGKAPLELSLEGLAPRAVVTDLVYTPLETPLLAAARARGATVVDGLGMLLWQAVPGFERWFGARPEVDEALRRAVLG